MYEQFSSSESSTSSPAMTRRREVRRLPKLENMVCDMLICVRVVFSLLKIENDDDGCEFD